MKSFIAFLIGIILVESLWFAYTLYQLHIDAMAMANLTSWTSSGTIKYKDGF